MLTRRHIRVKVMQCIYALVQSKDDSLQKQEKFLRVSIENMYVLYLLILSLLAELHRLAEKHVSHASKKYVATAEDKYCLLYTSPSPRDGLLSRMPSSA